MREFGEQALLNGTGREYQSVFRYVDKQIASLLRSCKKRYFTKKGANRGPSQRHLTPSKMA